jgi:hypothetical protein
MIGANPLSLGAHDTSEYRLRSHLASRAEREENYDKTQRGSGYPYTQLKDSTTYAGHCRERPGLKYGQTVPTTVPVESPDLQTSKIRSFIND